MGKSVEFLESLSKAQKVIDDLLDHPDGDIRFLRAVYPKLKASMDTLHSHMRQDIRTVGEWLAKYQGKPQQIHLFEDYSDAAAIVETLLDEASAPRCSTSLSYPQAPTSNGSSHNGSKKIFSISNFDPNLPKGPTKINVFKVNPLESLVKNISFPQSIFSIDLESKIDFELQDLPAPIWVDTEEGLRKMASELQKHSEIAVDLENHSFYSYYGFSCLMQISTRTADYLIDTVILRDSLKTHLQSIFEDPSVLKILHGAESDIYWLQRDFGIFVAGIFDSFYASRKLGLERQSLSFLISHFFNYDLDKSLQTADWRIRPLTQEMTAYAQLDTHCLFPLFDIMRINLITRCGREGLLEVLKRSSSQSLKIYKPEVFDEKSTVKQLGQLDKSLEDLAFRVVRWRDDVAKSMDICHFAVASPKDLKETILLKTPHRHIKKLPLEHVLKLETILIDDFPIASSKPVEFKKREHIFFEDLPSSKKRMPVRVKSSVSCVSGSSLNTSIPYQVNFAHAAPVTEPEEVQKEVLESSEELAKNPVREFQPIRHKDGRCYDLEALTSRETSAESNVFESVVPLPAPQFLSTSINAAVDLTNRGGKILKRDKNSVAFKKEENPKPKIAGSRPNKIFRKSRGKVNTFM